MSVNLVALLVLTSSGDAGEVPVGAALQLSPGRAWAEAEGQGSGRGLWNEP
jgi:hypothetical protein